MKIKTLFFENYVNRDVVEKVRESVLSNKEINVSFDVMGRTKHMQLANELSNMLPEFEFEIAYNYVCNVKIK